MLLKNKNKRRTAFSEDSQQRVVVWGNYREISNPCKSFLQKILIFLPLVENYDSEYKFASTSGLFFSKFCKL